MKADQLEAMTLVFGGETVISMADISDYFDVVKQAYDVHIDREHIRHGLWKEYPAEDQCNQIKIKIDRVLRSLERLRFIPENTAEQRAERAELRDNVKSELHDIINYAIFGHRIVDGRVTY